MKILVISQFYAPEPFLVDKICETLVQQGHEVTVVTGTPNYPKGKVYEGYEKGKRKDEVINGVRIHRCREIPRKKGILFRLLNYYSFQYSSTAYVKKLKETFDVVFCYQLSPVMQANAALVYQKKTGVPFVCYCLDLWPESLTVGKVNQKSFVYKHYFKVSKKLYTAADKLLVSSRPFQTRLRENFGIAEEKIAYLPQHGEDLFSPCACKKEPDGYCDLLFAGNIGLAQSVETVILAAKELENRPDIRFHIVGDGTSAERVKKLATDLDVQNVTFYGKRPLSEMPAFYKKADGMLVTFAKDEVLSLTLPLKVVSYLSAGKPVVCAADGETAAIIREADCGYTGNAEEVNALTENILRLAEDRQKERLGENARAYFETHFTKEKFLEGLDKAFKEVAKKDGP